jgi:hypothetical protein
MARTLSFLVAAASLAGCGGQLFLPESVIREDPSTKPCTVFNPQGACPEGLQCCSGVCDQTCDSWQCSCQSGEACVGGVCSAIDPADLCSIPNKLDGLCPWPEVCVGGTCVPISGSCGCEPELACVAGVCRAIEPGEACAPEKLDGLCPDGEVCMDGACVALNNACTPGNPNGLCPTGASCTGGRCVPIDRPCSAQALDGQCPSCYQCVAPGRCELLECTEAPSCACPNAGEYCDAGTCKPFACGPTHLDGECPEGQFCCTEGRCVDDRACCSPADCTDAGNVCSPCDNRCIPEGVCTCDDDCPDYYECESPVCVRDLDCAANGDADCLAEEYCDSNKTCRGDETCDEQADCDLQGLTDTFCAACKVCLSPGQCCETSDCTEPNEYCSFRNNCLVPPACDTTDDCGPASFCNSGTCELTGDDCTANGPSSCVAVGGNTVWCCPGDRTCCDQGERCSPEGKCIPDGRCVNDADCYPSYFTCDRGTYTCVPIESCTGGGCPEGQTCSEAGGCIPDDGTCAADKDCPNGEVCNALWQCEPAIGCDSQGFVEATKVPPNMLVVLDRSGSMNECLPCPPEEEECVAQPGCAWDSANSECDDICSDQATNKTDCLGIAGCGWTGSSCLPGITRFDTAAEAIESVLTAWETEIRFGLSLYPGVVGCDVGCSYACNWRSDACNSCGANPGTHDVRVGADTSAAITTAIAGTAPGGATPTAPTLREVQKERDKFGLPLTDDPIVRNNYVLLVTDGDANNGGTDNECSLGTSQADLVNCAINRLHVDEVPVETFVVGFAFGGNPSNLNCHAYYGGTARTDLCPGINASNCSSYDGTCYYPADNEAELVNAMTDIVGSVTSCDYLLSKDPSDEDFLSVYLYHQCHELSVDTCEAKPGCQKVDSTCIGDPVRVEKGDNGWEYDKDSNQVKFLGDSCATVQAGGVVPVVILGCETGEGV